MKLRLRPKVSMIIPYGWQHGLAGLLLPCSMILKQKKDTTKPDNIVHKVLGESKSFDNSAVAWGRKQEPIAKKRYKAYKKLKEGKIVHVSNMLCTENP